MKNNKVLIIIAVIMLNVLVVFMIGQSLLGKTSKYDATVIEARNFAEQELCAKSIAKYNEALVIKDTLDIRLEMLDVYEKGIDIGEFVATYDIFNTVITMVDTYRNETVIYEEACELLLKYNRTEDCANLLIKAKDLNVTSEKIEEFTNQIRYQYMKYFCSYAEVLPSYDGMYTVKTDDGYTYLNDEGSPDFNSTFLNASSFCEGYACVVATHPDGTDKCFIINKENERQIYLNGVESSSGVGKTVNENEEVVYLASCKIGEKYKYYDINGAEVLGEYQFAGRFRNNVAAVKEAEGKWKIINGTGKAISDKVFEDVILNEFDECSPKGFIIAKSGGKYHIYDLQLNQIGDFSCDYAKAFVDEYAAFKQGDLWGFVNTEGKVIIEPQYADAKSFSNKMGAIMNSDGWFFINPDNEIVIMEAFEDVDYLNDKGICFVKSDGYWSYLKMYYTEK